MGPELVGGLGSLYDEIQGIMGNDHMDLPANRQTNMTANITFLQLRWRADKWKLFQKNEKYFCRAKKRQNEL